MGGIAGSNYGNIEQCINHADIISKTVNTKAPDLGGGISGYCGQRCIIQNCYNIGNIQSSIQEAYTGGIVGEARGSIANCFSTGDTPGNNGAIIGINTDGYISNCYHMKGEDKFSTLITSDFLASSQFVDQLNKRNANTLLAICGRKRIACSNNRDKQIFIICTALQRFQQKSFYHSRYRSQGQNNRIRNGMEEGNRFRMDAYCK